MYSSTHHTPRHLYPRKRTPVPLDWEAEWAPELVLTFWRRGNLDPPPTEFRTQDCPGRSLVGIPTALSRATHVRPVCSLVWQHAHTRVGQGTRAYHRGSIWQGHWHLCLHHSLSKTALRPTGSSPGVCRPDGDTEQPPLSRIGLEGVKLKRSCFVTRFEKGATLLV